MKKFFLLTCCCVFLSGCFATTVKNEAMSEGYKGTHVDNMIGVKIAHAGLAGGGPLGSSFSGTTEGGELSSGGCEVVPSVTPTIAIAVAPPTDDCVAGVGGSLATWELIEILR